ncbi:MULTISPECIES: hypothetical protein [Sorangium]|uniref:hypothetical protein n=1 Tax=Sorangium TaxID=39643 RepID=UPI0013EB4629|nr:MULTISPECIES: hypothetical protein [Sorangium]
MAQITFTQNLARHVECPALEVEGGTAGHLQPSPADLLRPVHGLTPRGDPR